MSNEHIPSSAFAAAVIVGAGALDRRLSAVHRALARSAAPAASGAAAFDANAFVQIGADGVVTVISKHTEVGEGSIPAWRRWSPKTRYRLGAGTGRRRAGGHQYLQKPDLRIRGTGGSSSVANAYEQMRRMGAIARAAGAGRRTELENLGAGNYRAGRQDPPCRQRARGGLRREVRAGRHAAAARSRQPDAEGSGQFHPDRQNARPARVDSLAKTNGSAQFSQDIHEPDMLTVTIKPPRFGGKVATFDAERALAVPGVVAVKQIATGVAVYAKTHRRRSGQERLKVTWDDAQAERRNTRIYAEFRQVAQKTGVVAKSLSKPDEVFDKADKVMEAEYTFYVAHAPMEPLDGYLFWDGESVKARYGCQIKRSIASSCAICSSCRRTRCRLKPFWRAAASAGASIRATDAGTGSGGRHGGGPGRHRPASVKSEGGMKDA